MSYLSIAACVVDAAFNDRVRACVGQEGFNPYNMPPEFMWTISGKQDIEAAYKFALDSGNPEPGGDEAVITDAMILSAVQSVLLPPPPPEEP